MCALYSQYNNEDGKVRLVQLELLRNFGRCNNSECCLECFTFRKLHFEALLLIYDKTRFWYVFLFARTPCSLHLLTSSLRVTRVCGKLCSNEEINKATNPR